jgi:hypothetical protein
MASPYRLDRHVSDLQMVARQAGDRVAYADAWTARADAWAYQAAFLGIPTEYLHATFGTWDVPEDVCWGCGKPIAGPVVALGVNAECRHYHPACQSSADFEHLHEDEHGRPGCNSRLPHYIA